jgi:tetratricopeptide (TPR) repeat protein
VGNNVRNELSGSVMGPVVQAGTIGHLVLYPQPLAAEVPVPRQLPAAVSDFDGRAEELADLDRLLPAVTDGRAVRVVVIDGIGGVGKTTLALLWAHRVERRFPDGTLFANLRGHGPGAALDAQLVLTWFLEALGVAPDRMPADRDAQSALYRSLMAGRRMLVVLDNAASSEQVRPLLPAAAGCLALVTSRAALTGLVITEAAERLAVDLLSAGDAMALVRRIIGEERAAAEAGAVTRLVDVCGRLPLALRIAATRVITRSHAMVADIAGEIADERNGLDALNVREDERSAVGAVFDWTYNRLAGEHARTFRRLGLHPGTEFGLHALSALTGLDEASAQRHLDVLADLHLVEPVLRGRYRLHDLLHTYAAQRAGLDDAAQERRGAVTAVLGWYARAASAADRLVFHANPSAIDAGEAPEAVVVKDRGQALAWLSAEHITLQTALRQAGDLGAHREAMAIASAMRFLALRPRALWPARLQAEGRGLDAARACVERRLEALFLLRRGDTLQQMGQWEASDTDLYGALALAERLGDPALRGNALACLGRNRVLQERFVDAEPYYREALHSVRGGYVEAVAYTNLALIATRLGRYREALDHAEQGLALRRTIGATTGIAYALHDVAVARQSLGEHQEAIGLCKQALPLFRAEPGGEQYVATVLETLAASLPRVGDLDAAVRCLAEAVSILTELGDPRAGTLRQRLPIRKDRQSFTATDVADRRSGTAGWARSGR